MKTTDVGHSTSPVEVGDGRHLDGVRSVIWDETSDEMSM